VTTVVVVAAVVAVAVVVVAALVVAVVVLAIAVAAVVVAIAVAVVVVVVVAAAVAVVAVAVNTPTLNYYSSCVLHTLRCSVTRTGLRMFNIFVVVRCTARISVYNYINVVLVMSSQRLT
jgi:hypothetical protein